MFRLPNDSYSMNKLKSYTSYYFESKSYPKRQSCSLIFPRKSTFNLSSNQSMASKYKIRPQTSHTRSQEVRDTAKSCLAKSRLMLDQQGLISPSNKKFKFFCSQDNQSNIDQKMASSNFLLEPCKIQQMQLKSRKQQARNEIGKVQKYSSPYSVQVKVMTESEKKYKKIARGCIRQYAKQQPVRKQQQLQPWQSADCYFESIKLNPKYI